MNWNKSYQQGRDYQWLSTASLSWLLDLINYRANSQTNEEKFSALDIGCGTGQVVRDLYHRGMQVKGIDISDEAIKLAKQSTIKKDSVTFEYLNIEENVMLQEFDLVLCKYVLAFVNDKDKLLTNVKKMLRSEASFFVVVSPNPQFTPEAKKHITIAKDVLEELLHSHFSNMAGYERNGDFWYICKK